ncbi:thioesterase family protein [Sphingobium boeckii]|uniref:Acyl-CoA thioesterase n=1 Tax=Sphingobium boeckii TaxID=1082345 RepID=A0A7W9AJ18_9SPHN|nr:thioesterase family protein [Sphingobium boeckii]MBB5686587.1 acyl-CoA thioesterase [Sphingobium boeckii]
MTLAEIIAGGRPNATGLDVTLPETWMQGRTAYGGVSAALALTAAQGVADDLPPLRTAQISFIGPLSGDVSISAETLRRGRTAAFIDAEVRSEAGLGMKAMFVFMGDQPSHIDHEAMPAPAIFPDPAPVPKSVGAAKFFFQNFEYIEAASDTPKSELLRWVRLKARDGVDPMVALLAVADALPPAALGLATEKGPVSSMTWLVNMLAARPDTTDGWWLLKSATEYARSGCSSQTMAIWNADGVPVASGMQSVAIFS